jgi:hypothetical protein
VHKSGFRSFLFSGIFLVVKTVIISFNAQRYARGTCSEVESVNSESISYKSDDRKVDFAYRKKG